MDKGELHSHAAQQEDPQNGVRILQPFGPPGQNPLSDDLVQRPKPCPRGDLRIDRLKYAFFYGAIQMALDDHGEVITDLRHALMKLTSRSQRLNHEQTSQSTVVGEHAQDRHQSSVRLR